MEDPMMDNADAPPEESSNRPFIIGVAVLVGVLVLGLIGIGLFAFVFAPAQRAARESTNATRIAANAATADAATQIASLPSETPVPSNTPTEAVTETPEPTETPVVAPSETPAPTNTSAVSETPSGGSSGGAATSTTTATAAAASATPTRTTTRAAGSGTPGTPGGGAGGSASATPTKLPSRTPSPLPVTATATAIGTGSGGAVLTATPIGLPNTGFADDVGVQNLLIVGLALIAIVIIARRLRYSLR